MKKPHAVEIVELARRSQVWLDAVAARAGAVQARCDALTRHRTDFLEHLEQWRETDQTTPRPVPALAVELELCHQLETDVVLLLNALLEE